MSSDERDRNFDKAIARHLRSAAVSGDAANRPSESLSRSDSCADAETLAAYHERSLLPAEMNSWKEHVVGCARCQELLAQLEATDDIPLLAADTEEVFASTDGQTLAPAQPRHVRATRFSRGTRWRWLAPAGALAAGLLVWIAMHENHQAVLPNSNEIKMAKNQEPPAVTPPAAMSESHGEPEDRFIVPKAPSLGDKADSADRRLDEGILKQRQAAGYSSGDLPAKLSAKKESRLGKDVAREAAADLSRAQNQADLDKKTTARDSLQRAEVQSQAESVQVQNQSNLSVNATNAPGPAALGQVEASKKMKAAPAPRPSPQAGVGGATPLGSASQMVMVTSDPTWIAASGSSSVWRPGHAGLIEFSQDGGHSWTRQSSGVLVDLVSGTAPSEKVCWLVGRVGAILLTTDGGAHWKSLSSPLKEDLATIQATDALHATVWNSRGTKSYATSDGGLTWERFAKP